MHTLTAALSVFALLQTVPGASTSAPVPSKPHDRLVAAVQASSFDGEDLKPWHLKLSVTLYDEKGRNPVTGTIETWHSGNQSRTVYIFGTSKRTLLNTQNDSFQALEGSPVPALADYVLSEYLRPGPSQKEIDSAVIQMRAESFGNVKLDCIMLTQAIKHEEDFPVGLFPTYCLDPRTVRLRASYNFGSHTLLRNDLGHLQGQEVATHISFVRGGIQIADATTAAFNAFSPAAELFQPDAALTKAQTAMAQLSPGIVAGNILVKVQPIYPGYAKANHISGAVVLRAIIGRDGHIYYLRPISAPDPSLAIAAIQAVQHWIYKPYLLNGMPTDVDTNITVNYTLSVR